MSYSLSKILKYRRRVQARISQVSKDICEFNVVSAGEDMSPQREVDPIPLMEYRSTLVNHLIDLETRLNAANLPIQSKIIKLRELKGTIAFLKRISTSHGIVYPHFGDGPAKYSYACFRKNDIDEMIRANEMEIDAIQDEIDDFNATTRIELPNFGVINSQDAERKPIPNNPG